MIAVLIASSKPGETCWVNVRRALSIRISGMSAGDVVRVVFDNGLFEFPYEYKQDRVSTLPAGTHRVKVEHLQASGKSYVSVDLR